MEAVFLLIQILHFLLNIFQIDGRIPGNQKQIYSWKFTPIPTSHHPTSFYIIMFQTDALRQVFLLLLSSKEIQNEGLSWEGT